MVTSYPLSLADRSGAEQSFSLHTFVYVDCSGWRHHKCGSHTETTFLLQQNVPAIRETRTVLLLSCSVSGASHQSPCRARAANASQAGSNTRQPDDVDSPECTIMDLFLSRLQIEQHVARVGEVHDVATFGER
jgi:hypothetical protein